MPLTLNSYYSETIPLEVDAVTPEVTAKLSLAEIATLPVWRGRRKDSLSDHFSVEGEPSDQIVWKGSLENVDRIGQSMNGGGMRVQGNCGRFVGRQMTAGEIVVHGNAGDYLGIAMTGGKIEIAGDAGHHVAGRLPGEKRGVNRGQIFVSGNVLGGAGQGMRRGTLIVGGSTGELCGWNMIAGTIVTLGGFGPHFGAGMKRGTLIDLSDNQTQTSQHMLPTFQPGIRAPAPILKMLAVWLREQIANCQITFEQSKIKRLLEPMTLYHADGLTGAKGEIFLFNASSDKKMG